jgi:hypothetical protein
MKNETAQHNDMQKKPCRLKYLIPAVILLILLIFIAALFSSFLKWEQKPDPASEAIIREEAAYWLWKDPNEVTDEDFAKLTEFSFNLSRPGRFHKMVGSGKDARAVIIELSDITLLKKFTNLKKLQLNNVGYLEKNIPKWMKIMAKFGFIDLEDRFLIDLRPIEKLYGLQFLSLYTMPVKNIQPLSSLTNLEILSLERTRVCDLEPIKNLTKLKNLDISYTHVTILEPVKNLTNLQILRMQNCENLTEGQIIDLQQALPNLKIIK